MSSEADQNFREKKKQSAGLKLDVPSHRAQQRRKEALMERMLSDKKQLKTYKPQSSVLLSKVKDFLPQMKLANEKLEFLDKDEIQVDNVPEDSEAYVEMNLAMFSDSDSRASDEEDTDSESLASNESKGNIKSSDKRVQGKLVETITANPVEADQ